jgi:toxin ParE1/3/4
MKRFSLSFRAEHSLDLIGAYSMENFGSKRGEAYVDALLDRCRRIAMGNAPIHSCRDVFAPDLRSDLRFARSGRHFIIFTETPDEILIIDFIHQSADIGGRLEGLKA